MNAPFGWKIQLLATGVLLTSAYFGFEHSSPSRRLDPVPGVCYASRCRSTTQRDRFARLTGWPHGRPGWIIDHMRPLECHGADLPSNMWWQPSIEASIKDRIENQCDRFIPFDTTALDSSGRAMPQ